MISRTVGDYTIMTDRIHSDVKLTTPLLLTSNKDSQSNCSDCIWSVTFSWSLSDDNLDWLRH